jgi:hypothetical protein
MGEVGKKYEYKEKEDGIIKFPRYEKTCEGTYARTETTLNILDKDVIIEKVLQLQIYPYAIWIVKVYTKDTPEVFEYSRVKDDGYLRLFCKELKEEDQEDPHKGMVWYPMDQVWKYV